METSSYGGGGPAADDAQVWDRARTVRLIEMWSQSPALFDSTCLDYRNKYQRTAALNAIANELGLQDSEIRDKMRNLRSQYAREKTHEQKSTLPPSLASCFAYKSKWFYFRMLSFLDDFKRHVRSDSGSSRGNANVIGNPDAPDDSIYSNQASLTPGTDGGQDDADCADWAQSPQADHVTSASAAAALESRSRSEGSDCGDGGCGSGYTSGPSTASGRLAAGSGVAFAGRRGGGASVAAAAAVGSHTGAKRRKMNTRKLVLRRSPAAATEAAAVGLGVSSATAAAGGDLRSRGASESSAEELKEEPDGEVPDGHDAMAALTERLPVPVKLTCATKEEDEEQDEEDDEELFGRFVASELRKVASVRLKAVAKLRMHEALLDATAVASWQRNGPPAAATAAAVAGSGARRRM